MSDRQVSSFKSAKDIHPVNVSLESILDVIRSTRLRSQIERLRDTLKTRGKDAYNAQKIYLPAVTFGGTFTRRAADCLQAVSGYMICDIDNILDAEGVKELVAADEHVKAAFISPSGNGVKFLAAVPAAADAAAFSRMFPHVSAYFFDTYGLDLDKSGSDVSRLCFLSYDPTLLVNPDSDVIPFDIDVTVDAAMPETDDEPTAERIERAEPNDSAEFRQAVLQVLAESAGIVNNYEDFFRVLAACKRENVSYADFDAICQKSNGYNASGNLKAWNRFDAGKAAARSCTFGTLYDYATRTDEQRQRLNALLPTTTPQAADYHVDADMILAAGKTPRTPQGLKHVTERAMTPQAWCSDMDIDVTRFEQEVNAPCNHGKTAAIRKWVERVPEKWIVILTPTTPLREQIAADFPEFYEVKEKYAFLECHRVYVCTREKFVKSYPFERLTETFVVSDEIHLNTTDISYKPRMLAELQNKFDYCRTLGLTGTPIRFPHSSIHAERMKRDNAEPIRATWLYYTDTLPTIRETVKRDAARGLVPVFFLNSKDAIREAAEMLLSYVSISTAARRPYTVYRDDTTQEITPDAAVLRDTAAIPADCLCILTTSLFECGINLKSHAGTVVLFPRHKDHATRRQALAVHLPCEVVQSVSRFRHGWERLLIAIPSYQKCNRSTFDYAKEYAEYREIAEQLANAYNRQLETKRHYKHVFNVRADIAPEHRIYIRRTDSGAYVVYEQGIDYLLLESMRQAMTGDPVFYAEQLASEFTPVLIDAVERHTSTLTQEERAACRDIRDGIERQRADEWEQELTRLAEPDTALSEDGKVSRAEKWVRTFAKYAGKDAAVALVRQTGDEPQALATLQRQARREKYLQNRERVTVSTFDKIDALVHSRKEWESASFMKAVTPFLACDPFLLHMVTGKTMITRFTPNRAARIMEGFAGVTPVVKKQAGKAVRVYELNSRTPFQDAVLQATGQQLDAFPEWKKYAVVSELQDEERGYTFEIDLYKEKNSKSVTDEDARERAAIMEYYSVESEERAAIAEFGG